MSERHPPTQGAPFEHVYGMQGSTIKRLENNVQDNWAEAWS